MKIDAQINNQPTIRNIAKLLMNNMYGRYGIHTDNIRQAIVDQAKFTVLSRNYYIKERIELGALLLISYTLGELPPNISQNKVENA